MSLKELYELQQIDLALAERQKALDEVRAEIANDSEIVRARHRLERISAEHITRSALSRDAQLVVEQLEERDQQVQNRLYSGAITNPRELAAFQEEQAMLRRQIEEAEDTLLGHMLVVDNIKETLENVQQTVSALEERRALRAPQLRLRERNLSELIETLNSRRSEMLPQFPPQMLSMYETILATREGQAVCKVEFARGREICGTCRVALPRSDSQRVRNDDAIVQCNNCRRILYLDME